MHKTYSFGGVVAASILASAFSMAAFSFVEAAVTSPEPAYAESPVPRNVELYAMPRGSEGKNESFIFYNEKTGDIWVYRDFKFRDHYQLKELGKNMDQIEVDPAAP